MLERIVVLVFAMLSHFAPGLDRRADKKPVVGIATLAMDPEVRLTPEELATMVVYGSLESWMKDRPHPYSWDSKGGVSCGFLQEPCGFVQGATDARQARWWIDVEREAGLANLDSSPKRAAYRTRLAKKLLREIRECPWHAHLLDEVFGKKVDTDATPYGTLIPTAFDNPHLSRTVLFADVAE